MNWQHLMTLHLIEADLATALDGLMELLETYQFGRLDNDIEPSVDKLITAHYELTQFINEHLPKLLPAGSQ